MYSGTGSFVDEIYISVGYAGGVALDSEDRIVANTNTRITRVLNTGERDAAFSGGYGDESLAPFATGAEVLLVDDADRAIVLGESTDTFRVIRYLEDGTLDPSFATGGLVEIDPGYTTFRARTLRLQSDGKIVVGGIADAGSGNEFAAVRICP